MLAPHSGLSEFGGETVDVRDLAGVFEARPS